MTDFDHSPASAVDVLNTPAFDEAYLDLTRYAYTRTRDREEAEELVSDTVLTWVQDVRAGKQIDNMAGYLRRVFECRRNDYLRRKYRREVEMSDDGTLLQLIPDSYDPEELSRSLCEAEAVRKALGRLATIYREVVYRHYMKGQGVEEIARALGVPVGTVKSRLSDGRGQMKEVVMAHLNEQSPYSSAHSVAEKIMNSQNNDTRVGSMPEADTRAYADASYAPKHVTISIWGNAGTKGEPFCYLRSLVAQNILVLAYEKPISIRELSAALGIPTPYIEYEVDALVQGELLGRTAGGLVYTRMFMQTVADEYGDVDAQEALAAEIAPTLGRLMEEHLAPLWGDETSATRSFSEKQMAGFRLMLVNRLLTKVIFTPEMEMRPADICPLARPNGGWWLATGTVYDHDQKLYSHKYSGSGPVQVNHVRHPQKEGEVPERLAMMLDYQSFFGDGHWRYGQMKYSFGLQEILKFYASLFTDAVKPGDDRIYEMLPEFEEMGVLHRAEDGHVKPDIPALPFTEWDKWEAAMNAMVPALAEVIAPSIQAQVLRTVNRIPPHVDGREAYLHAGALRCLIPATMKAMVDQGFITGVTMGKTPVILVMYRPSGERAESAGDTL